MLGQFLHISGRLGRQVVAYAGGDEHLLDAGQLAGAPVELDQRRVIGIEIRTDAGEHAGRSAAGAFDLTGLAGKPVHVGRRAAQVGDHPGEARNMVPDFLDLADNGLLGTILDDPAFVLGDRAEGTAPEATALNGDGEANHLVGGNVGIPVEGVRQAAVGPLVHPVHLLGRQRNGRRVEPHVEVAVPLYEGAGVAGVGFQMKDARCVRIQHRVFAHLLE